MKGASLKPTAISFRGCVKFVKHFLMCFAHKMQDGCAHVSSLGGWNRLLLPDSLYGVVIMELFAFGWDLLVGKTAFADNCVTLVQKEFP